MTKVILKKIHPALRALIKVQAMVEMQVKNMLKVKAIFKPTHPLSRWGPNYEPRPLFDHKK